jgi:hypothetical protein
MKRAWVLVLLGSAWSACFAQDGSLDIVGDAFDLDSGEFLYRELHDCGQREQLCTVDYVDQSGILIARKSMDYTSNPFQPRLSMTNLRSAEQFHYEPELGRNLVADAGFDNFVRDSWQDLEAGRKVNFEFVVLGMDKPLRMTIRQDSAASCAQDRTCLKIVLDSWLLRNFVDPIKLVYSSTDQKLLRFSGVSNIKAVDGGSLNVNILYSYGEEEWLQRVF